MILRETDRAVKHQTVDLILKEGKAGFGFGFFNSELDLSSDW